MSREIKFRAWRLDGGMHKPFDLTNLVSNECAGESWLDCGDGLHIDHRTGWDSLKIMQYTGLKDKNGREIYEGDVVSVCFNGKVKNCWEAVVEWCKINPSFFLKKVNPPCLLLDEYDFVKCELLELLVIGNIYENPELITEVKNG